MVAAISQPRRSRLWTGVHGAAVRGASTGRAWRRDLRFCNDLDLLPEDKLGVAVIATKDVSNAVTERIGEEALRLILARRAGKPLPIPPATSPVPTELGRALSGRYGTGNDAVELAYLDGHLTMRRLAGGEHLELRKLGMN